EQRALLRAPLPPPASIVRVIVLEPDGRPAAGAAVMRSRGNQRWLVEDDVLGRADEQGIATIPAASLPTIPADLVVHKKPFLPELVRAASPGDTYTIKLSSGTSFAVYCATPEGEPVEGVQVLLTK